MDRGAVACLCLTGEVCSAAGCLLEIAKSENFANDGSAAATKVTHGSDLGSLGDLNDAAVETDHVEVIQIEQSAQDGSPGCIVDSETNGSFLNVVVKNDICAVGLVETVNQV